MELPSYHKSESDATTKPILDPMIHPTTAPAPTVPAPTTTTPTPAAATPPPKLFPSKSSFFKHGLVPYHGDTTSPCASCGASLGPVKTDHGFELGPRLKNKICGCAYHKSCVKKKGFPHCPGCKEVHWKVSKWQAFKLWVKFKVTGKLI